MEQDKKQALYQLLLSDNEGLSIDDIEYSNDYYKYGDEEYLVYTDEESADAWNESIDQYIDDCVLCELPEQYRNYFDSEAFKRDCSFDGRGHTLATYDGEENEEKVNDVFYFIYRIN